MAIYFTPGAKQVLWSVQPGGWCRPLPLFDKHRSCSRKSVCRHFSHFRGSEKLWSFYFRTSGLFFILIVIFIYLKHIYRNLWVDPFCSWMIISSLSPPDILELFIILPAEAMNSMHCQNLHCFSWSMRRPAKLSWHLKQKIPQQLTAVNHLLPINNNQNQLLMEASNTPQTRPNYILNQPGKMLTLSHRISNHLSQEIWEL